MASVISRGYKNSKTKTKGIVSQVGLIPLDTLSLGSASWSLGEARKLANILTARAQYLLSRLPVSTLCSSTWTFRSHVA